MGSVTAVIFGILACATPEPDSGGPIGRAFVSAVKSSVHNSSLGTPRSITEGTGSLATD